MIHFIVELFRSYPQIAIFLALAAGYYIGKINIRGFSLGATTGCLIAALIIGQVRVEVPVLLKTVAFALFIFGIGYKVGPQFFGGLKREGLKYLWVSIVVAVVGLVTALFLGKLLSFDEGTTAGLLGGAMTQSAIIGTADGAIKQLPITAAAKTILESNVAIAYAITYIFGTIGLIIALKLMPRIMKIDLKDEARKLEQEMSGGAGKEERPELFSWHKQIDLRAFRVTNTDVAGKTASELETLFPGRVAVDKIKRGDRVIDPAPDTVIQSDDVVAIVGYRSPLVKGEQIVGPEVDDRLATDITGELLDICVLNKDPVGKTLGELSATHGHGLFLKRVTRQGLEMPITRDTVIHKCDVLQVAGARKDVERAVLYLGFPERPTVATDLITVGIAIVLGTLLGLVAVPLFGIPITLGVGGGVLVSGLFFGWLRSLHPTFGQIPGPAVWIFTDLGLNLFIVCVGLIAGARALDALQTTGVALLVAGAVVTLVPMLVGMGFGRLVLKMNHVLLFGALTGAETCTAALNAVKEDADSALPAIGYTVPYAIGNVLLTVWGTVIVNVMHRMS